MRPVMIIVTVAAALGVGSAIVHAQSWEPPTEAQRCPSKWGAADQRGAANHMKPETVLRATRLIRTGEVIELAHVLSESMPIGEGRRFEVITKRSPKLAGSNRRGGNEELLISEIGHVGTQLDSLANNTIGDSFYNCVKVDDVATRTGFKRLGVENVGALMTRGVLIDVAALKGVEMLPDTYEITAQDLQQALERENLTLHPGDAVLINTGWSTLWSKDTARYVGRHSGPGSAGAEWLARQDPMLVGADNVNLGVTPNPDPKVSLPNHQILLVVNGIYIIEHLKLDELVMKRVYEFAFIVQPLKMQGFAGSTVAPIAVR